MNVLNAVGNVGRISLITTAGGEKALNFTLAVNTGRKDNPQTTWYNCSFFGKRAESVAPYIKKGDALGVSGAPSMRSYTAKEGDERMSLDLWVNDVTLLGMRSGGASEESTTGSLPTEFEDDIPV